jgi:pantothenate synthetase
MSVERPTKRNRVALSRRADVLTVRERELVREGEAEIETLEEAAQLAAVSAPHVLPAIQQRIDDVRAAVDAVRLYEPEPVPRRAPEERRLMSTIEAAVLECRTRGCTMHGSFRLF